MPSNRRTCATAGDARPESRAVRKCGPTLHLTAVEGIQTVKTAQKG